MISPDYFIVWLIKQSHKKENFQCTSNNFNVNAPKVYKIISKKTIKTKFEVLELAIAGTSLEDERN